MRQGEEREHLNPKGQLTHVQYMHYPVLTNANPDYICPGSTRMNAERKGMIQIQRSDDDLSMCEPDDWHILRRVGFTGMNPGSDEQRYHGKFVYMKDGTFFLAAQTIPHAELPALIGKHDRVAVLSAGFIFLTHAEVTTFGRSESLDRDPDEFSQRDRNAIAEHLGIPFKQEV